MSEFVLQIESTMLEKSLFNIARNEGYDIQQVIITALENFVRQKTPMKTDVLDPFQHSTKINYHITEDLSGVKPFADVKDSAAFGKALRLKAWGRTSHE